MRIAIVLVLAIACLPAVPSAQESLADSARQKAFDQILDVYVRDGYVYYRALKLERSRLDRYVGSLAIASIESAPRDEQLAFWLNAYNALVLRTIIDRYPIPHQSRAYPPHSVRQIPGAFERLPHRVAGRTVTLDQIEQTILPTFRDPRVYLAIGRGAVGSGRLRSEAFAADRLEAQLTEAANECASRLQCIQIDRTTNKVMISSIFSWREKEFAPAYADAARKEFSERSPIERAALALVEPKLLTSEREFLANNQFQVSFVPFDWSLNDLTGRGGR